MPHFALRALRSPGPQIMPHLEIKTLLANNLVTEAFELQRTKRDETLLMEFFKCCHEQKKWGAVMKLALTEKEGEILGKFLHTCESLLSENLQFVYLLQRNKYIEALSYLQNAKHQYKPKASQDLKTKNRSQNLILSAFKLAMAPSEQKLSNVYLSLKGRVETAAEAKADKHGTESEDLKPFSSELNSQYLSNKQNVFGGIFHRALISSKDATNHLLHPTMTDSISKSYVPFLSKPQIDFDYVENNNYKPITCAVDFVPTAKRRKDASFEQDDEPEYNQAAKRKRTDDFVMTSQFVKQSQEINKSLLTSFKQRPTMTPSRLPAAENAAEHSPVHDQDDDNENVCVNLLSTPIVNSTRLNNKSSPDRSERGRAQTPQSILKKTDTGSCSQSRRSVSPSLTAGSARRSVDFDERSLRYHQRQLNLDVSEEGGPLTTIPESVDDNASESSSSYTRIKARPPIRSSGENSPASTSADEFFSPNTSKYSELEEALVSAANRSSLQLNRSTSHRQSRSPSRDSTPEVESQRVTRSKSRQLNTSDEHDEKADDSVFTRAKSSTPLQLPKPKAAIESHKSPKKSLSRIAVEMSARKLIARRMTDEKSDDIPVAPKDVSASGDSINDSYAKLPENILIDYSNASESSYQQYLQTLEKDTSITSMNSSIVSNNRDSINYLEDFSSSDESKWQKIFDKRYPKTDQRDNDDDKQQEVQPENMETSQSEMVLSNSANVIKSIEPSAQQAGDAPLSNELLPFEPIPSTDDASASIQVPDPELPESSVQLERSANDRSQDVKSDDTYARLPQSILVDKSQLSESYVEQYEAQFSSYDEQSYSEYTQYKVVSRFLVDDSLPDIITTDPKRVATGIDTDGLSQRTELGTNAASSSSEVQFQVNIL